MYSPPNSRPEARPQGGWRPFPRIFKKSRIRCPGTSLQASIRPPSWNRTVLSMS